MKPSRAGVGYSSGSDSFQSGRIATQKAIDSGNIERPDLILAFCTAQVDDADFFAGIRSATGPRTPIFGGSAVGVITPEMLGYSGPAAAVAVIETENFTFTHASVGNLDRGEFEAGQGLVKKLSPIPADALMLLFYDSIRSPAGPGRPPVLNASTPLLAGIQSLLDPAVPIFGAGLIGDYAFGPTRQFCGSFWDRQQAVGIMLSGNSGAHFRIMHGCSPLDGVYHVITDMAGALIRRIDDRPIVQVIDEIYQDGSWKDQHPVNYLTIGVNHGEKYDRWREQWYVNRLITGVMPDESGVLLFEPDLEPGTEIQFMVRDAETILSSVRKNTAALIDEIRQTGNRPVFGLYIDCAGRTAEYSLMLVEEADLVRKALQEQGIAFIGFYSGVEIAPLLQRSRGLDWTGVLLIITENVNDADPQ